MKEVSQEGLAEIIGLSTRQIRNLEKDGIPHRAEGMRKFYPIPAAVQWYMKRKQDEAMASLGEIDYHEARARREQARARMAEIEVAKAEGRLVERDVVHAVYGGKVLDVLRAGILNVPGRWASQVVGLESPREAEAILKRVSAELLEEFAGPVADGLESGGSSLPDECPEVDRLRAAGIETMSDLMGVDDLKSLPGIGAVTERRILEWLEGDAA
jgi:phage terminase Nu1 subunit (DNA packaging protein)